MRTFAINTLGCKVNQYESQQIRELLEHLGLHQAETFDHADLIVINTCCVTHTASAKSRQFIRKAQKLNSNTTIVVSGCLPTVHIDKPGSLGKNTHLVRHREDLAATLGKLASDKITSSNLQSQQNNIIKTENETKVKPKTKVSNRPEMPQLTSFKGHTRAFLKIQDGCDGYCSYCIIPKTRPQIESKPVQTVLEEAQALVAAGHREIVVTGIFLGAYGQKSVRRKNWLGGVNRKLAELLDKMAKIPNLARIRLSSLEPGDVTEGLLDVFCEHRNIMPHLHLSLQSGSDTILRKMCRQYRADEFMKMVELVKGRLDRPALTCDIIVGFPGETEEDFSQTVELAKQVRFAKMHVFSFSPHNETGAAVMQGAVKKEVIKERSEILHELGSELAFKYREQFIGERAVVLVENIDGRPSGRSERYFMVEVEVTSGSCKKNELLEVTLLENGQDGMFGKMIGKT